MHLNDSWTLSRNLSEGRRAVATTRPPGQSSLIPEETCRSAENSIRPMSAQTGEALLVAAEDLCRLVLMTEWTDQDKAQLCDLARSVLAIINSIGVTRPA